MIHGQTRERIGTYIVQLVDAGYSVDIHLNRISGQYRVVCTHHATDVEFCIRDASLCEALSLCVREVQLDALGGGAL